MTRNRALPSVAGVIAAGLILLAGCAGSGGDAARARADLLAQGAGLHRVDIATSRFRLVAFMRAARPAAMLRVYIEGDGHAWRTPDTPSADPTPWSPVALELAVRDPAPAVAWLARPCQYVAPGSDPFCREQFWTDARYSAPVIASVAQALDQLKLLAGASQLELVGYSGGGAVAVLVAVRRNDLASLRTVAAYLDTALWTSEHAVTPLWNSLNPADAAAHLAMLPQIHFVGGADSVVDESVVRSYAKAAGRSGCLAVVVTPGLRHGDDWAEAWPRLLLRSPACTDVARSQAVR